MCKLRDIIIHEFDFCICPTVLINGYKIEHCKKAVNSAAAETTSGVQVLGTVLCFIE